MSHSVTIQTRTVTTGSPSALNTSFFKTWTGVLKLVQVILGAVSVGLIGYGYNRNNFVIYNTEIIFFFLIATTFFIVSTIIVLSCLCSYTTESILSKTIFELLYHAFGFALLLAASIVLLVNVNSHSRRDHLQIAAICGIVNCALYLIVTIFALRTSRGL